MYVVPDRVTARRSNELASGFNSKHIPYRVMNGTHVIFAPYHATFHGPKTLTTTTIQLNASQTLNRRMVDTLPTAAPLRPVATLPTDVSSRSNCHHFVDYLKETANGRKKEDSIAFHHIEALSSALDSCFKSDSIAKQALRSV